MFYSFDIFDTLITRQTGNPQGVFLYVQERLKKNNICNDAHFVNNFYTIRCEAEKLAREKNWKEKQLGEVRLEEIYCLIGNMYSMEYDILNRIMQVEVEIEILLSVPIESNINKLVSLLESNEVVLISDMYLSKDVIRKMLVKHNRVFNNIRIYVSSENYNTKSSGKLFEYVKKVENVEFSNWIHIGDNYKSDYERPRTLGINAEKYEYVKLREYESEFLVNNVENLSAQFIVGASKNSVLSLNKINGASITGTTMAGPILTGYVSWLIEDCIENNIDRLYFVARDGYVLKLIADKIIEKKHLSISTKYIYGSRKAWRFPSVDESFSSFSEVFKNSKTMEEVLETIGMTFEELFSFLPLRYSDVYNNIADDEKDSFVSYLLVGFDYDDELKGMLENYVLSKRSSVLGYLEQELDLSDNNFAFVELHGTGYTQICLANILKYITNYDIKSYFFEMIGIEDVSIHNFSFKTYLINQIPYNHMIELLCRAPHNQTYGYQFCNGKWLPLFEESNEADRIINHNFEDYCFGILKFVENIDFEISSLYVRWLVYKLNATWDRLVMDYLGDFPYVVGSQKNDNSVYAPQLSTQIVEKFLLENYNNAIKNYIGANIWFSCRRSGVDSNQFNYSDCSKKGDKTYSFPKNFLHGNIVLYGAGKVGQSFYKQMCRENVNCISWLDKNVTESLGATVITADEFDFDSDYDYILIAMLRKKQADEVIKYLLSRNVNIEKILYFNPI